MRGRKSNGGTNSFENRGGGFARPNVQWPERRPGREHSPVHVARGAQSRSPRRREQGSRSPQRWRDYEREYYRYSPEPREFPKETYRGDVEERSEVYDLEDNWQLQIYLGDERPHPGIPNFSGDDPKASSRQFLKSIDDVGNRENWPQERRKKQFALKLVGSARRWLLSDDGGEKLAALFWGRLKSLFLQTFVDYKPQGGGTPKNMQETASMMVWELSKTYKPQGGTPKNQSMVRDGQLSSPEEWTNTRRRISGAEQRRRKQARLAEGVNAVNDPYAAFSAGGPAPVRAVNNPKRAAISGSAPVRAVNKPYTKRAAIAGSAPVKANFYTQFKKTAPSGQATNKKQARLVAPVKGVFGPGVKRAAPTPGGTATNKKKFRPNEPKMDFKKYIEAASAKPPQSQKEAAESHLRVVVVNRHNPLGKVSAETANALKTYLTGKLRQAIKDGGFVPTFNKWTHFGEILRISCTDDAVLDWLTKAVEAQPQTPDTKLEVVREDRVPKLTKISMFIPEAKLDDLKEVREMLATQNPDVKVNSWCIFHKEGKDDGLLIVAGTSAEDIAMINAQGGKLFYEFATVKVRVTSPAGVQSPSGAAVPSQSSTEVIDLTSTSAAEPSQPLTEQASTSTAAPSQPLTEVIDQVLTIAPSEVIDQTSNSEEAQNQPSTKVLDQVSTNAEPSTEVIDQASISIEASSHSSTEVTDQASSQTSSEVVDQASTSSEAQPSTEVIDQASISVEASSQSSTEVTDQASNSAAAPSQTSGEVVDQASTSSEAQPSTEVIEQAPTSVEAATEPSVEVIEEASSSAVAASLPSTEVVDQVKDV